MRTAPSTRSRLDNNAHDSHHHDGLAEEETENLTEQELRQIVRELNVDEAAELIALTWIGRGDYEPAEFAEAVTEARQRNYKSIARYLLGMPMLGDWLEEGLEAIGVSRAAMTGTPGRPLFNRATTCDRNR